MIPNHAIWLRLPRFVGRGPIRDRKPKAQQEREREDRTQSPVRYGGGQYRPEARGCWEEEP